MCLIVDQLGAMCLTVSQIVRSVQPAGSQCQSVSCVHELYKGVEMDCKREACNENSDCSYSSSSLIPFNSSKRHGCPLSQSLTIFPLLNQFLSILYLNIFLVVQFWFVLHQISSQPQVLSPSSSISIFPFTIYFLVLHHCDKKFSIIPGSIFCALLWSLVIQFELTWGFRSIMRWAFRCV